MVGSICSVQDEGMIWIVAMYVAKIWMREGKSLTFSPKSLTFL